METGWLYLVETEKAAFQTKLLHLNLIVLIFIYYYTYLIIKNQYLINKIIIPTRANYGIPLYICLATLNNICCHKDRHMFLTIAIHVSIYLFSVYYSIHKNIIIEPPPPQSHHHIRIADFQVNTKLISFPLINGHVYVPFGLIFNFQIGWLGRIISSPAWTMSQIPSQFESNPKSNSNSNIPRRLNIPSNIFLIISPTINSLKRIQYII